MFTKSGVMVGLGETRNEVLQMMDDLRSADVDFLTIGQYLQPTPKHHPVERFVTPEEFVEYADDRPAKGFLLVVRLAPDALLPPRRRRFRPFEGRARGEPCGRKRDPSGSLLTNRKQGREIRNRATRRQSLFSAPSGGSLEGGEEPEPALLPCFALFSAK